MVRGRQETRGEKQRSRTEVRGGPSWGVYWGKNSVDAAGEKTLASLEKGGNVNLHEGGGF